MKMPRAATRRRPAAAGDHRFHFESAIAMNPKRFLIAAVLITPAFAVAVPVATVLPGLPPQAQPALAGQLPSGAAEATLATARYGHATAALPDGRVLVAGGNDGSQILRNAEIYDPATGAFAATGQMLYRRMYDAAGTVALADGRVLVSGGCVDLGGSSGGFQVCQGVPHSEIYDPATGQFAATGPLAGPRNLHIATRLADGRVLIATGSDSNPDGPQWTLDGEIYDPATGQFTTTGTAAIGRAYATAALLADGRVLIAGGQTDGGAALTHAEIYDPATGQFSSTGAMTAARIGPTATRLPDGRVLIVGGTNDSVAQVEHAEVYDPATGQFTALAAQPVFSRYYHSAIALPDGRIVFAGGNRNYTPIAPVELYDPALGTFEVIAELDRAVVFHTAAPTAGGDVLIAGGLDAGVVVRSEAQRIAIGRADALFADGFEP